MDILRLSLEIKFAPIQHYRKRHYANPRVYTELKGESQEFRRNWLKQTCLIN
jgi:hypothetical protein